MLQFPGVMTVKSVLFGCLVAKIQLNSCHIGSFAILLLPLAMKWCQDFLLGEGVFAWLCVVLVVFVGFGWA